MICYTSGTTGPPQRRDAQPSQPARQLRPVHADPQRRAPEPTDVVWLALPLFHIYGMNVGMNLAYMNGATIALIERFEPASSLDVVQKYQCTILYGAPPMYVAWVQLPNISDYNLSTLRYVASGAAALPVRVLEGFQGARGRADQRRLRPLRSVASRHDQRRRSGGQARNGRASHPWHGGQDRRCRWQRACPSARWAS